MIVRHRTRKPRRSRAVQSHDFIVLLHADESGGYWTSCPALPGCFSQGETMEEALTNTREAIQLTVEDLRIL